MLRHRLGLQEGEIAAAMTISAGSVQTHTVRGLAALTHLQGAAKVAATRVSEPVTAPVRWPDRATG